MGSLRPGFHMIVNTIVRSNDSGMFGSFRKDKPAFVNLSQYPLLYDLVRCILSNAIDISIRSD